jgi:hypothetical protein
LEADEAAERGAAERGSSREELPRKAKDPKSNFNFVQLISAAAFVAKLSQSICWLIGIKSSRNVLSS